MLMKVKWMFATGKGTMLPSFHHFDFLPQIHKYLANAEIHTPTYIQYALWCKMMRNKVISSARSDLDVQKTDQTNPHNNALSSFYHITSSTGSGKTLAYLLPLMQSLAVDEKAAGSKLTCSLRPRSLILTASKEQVLQIRSVGKAVSHHCKMHVDGVNIGRTMREQRTMIDNGVDILIGTHGRLSAMKQRGQFFMSGVKWIVIDEVDTFQSSGKLQSILKEFIVNNKNNTPRNVILSSTTCPPSLKTLLTKTLPPLTHIISPLTHIPLHNINHQFLHCQTLDKHDQVLSIISQKRSEKIMIFCNTSSSLNELEYYLEERGVRLVGTIHSRLNKNIRLKNYQLFRDCSEGVLLSTDLGARGLDFPNLTTVINYDFPLSPTDYLQRSGRTGRAGKKGSVITLYHKKDMPIIQQLRKAGFDKQVRVGDSAYSIKNRQDTGRTKFK